MPYILKENISPQQEQLIFSYQQTYGLKLFQQRLHQLTGCSIKLSKVMIQPAQHYLQIYSSIQQWDITKYIAPQKLYPNLPTILISLSGINFANLKTLELNSLNIDNVQPLSWFNAPYIQRILLFNNKIVSAKPIIKAYIPNALEIQLFRNPIQLFVGSQQYLLIRTNSFYLNKTQIYNFKKIRDKKKYMFL